MANTRTIMMVDDNPAIQKMFVKYFKSKGYNPVSVSDPRTVVSYIKKVTPDIILTAIAMEHMGGDSIIKILRKRGVTIPIIVVSGNINKKLILDLKDYNIGAYFAKPVNFDKLEVTIQSLLVSPKTGIELDLQPKLILITENKSIEYDPYTFIPRNIIEKHGLKVISKKNFQDSIELLKIPANNVHFVVVDAADEARTLTKAKLLKRVVVRLKIPICFVADNFSEHLQNLLIKLGMDNIISRTGDFENSFDAALSNIRNASQKRTTGKQSTILNDLETIKTLPPLPDIYLKIEKLAQNPRATTVDYSNVLKLDPGITTRLLRMSNSALFSFKRKIKSVKDAVSLMGTREIVSLVRVACITGNLKATLKVQKPVKKIWKHSANCAIAAKVIYEKTDICKTPELAEELFISGIIHDIGKIVLLEFFTDQYISFLNNSWVSTYPRVSEEKEILGTTHTEVGTAIADHWNLPEPLRDVIAFHHNPMAKPESDLVMIIHISDVVGKLIMGAIPEDQDLGLDSDLLKTIGYTSEQIRKLAVDLEPEITKMTAHATAIITG